MYTQVTFGTTQGQQFRDYNRKKKMAAIAPMIINRAQWGANPVLTPAGHIPTPSRELWLHHTAGEQFDEAGMRMLQSFTLHRPDEHYVDLEYTFVVDHQDCRIFESRGPGHDSAATGGHNSISHAICVMGNFEIDEPSGQLIETLANLVAWGYEQGWWPLGFTGGHRDASGNSTACPGDHLEAKIPTINTRAVAIHQGAPPTPPAPPIPPKVKPMYNPPLGPIAAVWKDKDGKVLAAVSPTGDVYAWAVPFRPWPNKAQQFGSRKAAQIGPVPGDPTGKRYQITATTGEIYAP